MTIENFNFAGKKAIVRVDFNVPLNENGVVTDETRIKGALPTLKKVLADGGALIIENAEYEAFIGKEPSAKKYISQIISPN